MMLRLVLDQSYTFYKQFDRNPKEEDHSEFRNRVFPKIDNLKGEHLLKLLKEDVKFNQLDDEDVVLLRSSTRGSSNSKSVHTRVRTEVRHEVHVRTEVCRNLLLWMIMISKSRTMNKLIFYLHNRMLVALNRWMHINLICGYFPTLKISRVIKTIVDSDGNEIQLLPWTEDLTRSPNASKRTMNVEDGHEPNDDWAMASPYLSDMLLRYEYPLYYADGIKYSVPWFVNNVEKV
nr:phospholipase-like protein [Tanacetum cinerariifolium]